MILPVLTEIDDRSRVAQCRRSAKIQARKLGFSEVDRERIGIAVTEGVSNVLRYGVHGYCLVQSFKCEQLTYLCVLLWDEGPGISNLKQCMEDGYSSATGQGIGLGAMKRQSDYFDIYTKPEGGLLVSMYFVADCSSRPKLNASGAYWDFFATAIPMPGEIVSGDSWAVVERNSMIKFMLVDGLGHGPKAEHAARLATECFESEAGSSGESIVNSLDTALKGSRGAVVAVAEVDVSASLLRFTGIGNIYGRLITETESSHLTSFSGTVGYQLNRVRTYEYPWNKNSMLILHSDGLGSRWNLDRFPGLAFNSSAALSAGLISDYRKTSDDCSILCVKPRTVKI